MSHSPTDPDSWSLANRWPQSDHPGPEPTAAGRASAQRPADGGWPAPNGSQPPPPRVYGRATATPQVYGPAPSPPQVYGLAPSPPQVYGPAPSPPQVYGQPPSPPQVYGQPTAADPYPQPASTPPVYGMPQPVSADESPRWKKPGPVLMTALVAGLLFVLSGVLTVLYVMKSTDLSRAEGELRTQGAQVDQLKKDLQTANDRAAKTQQDLTGTKNARDELERQKQVISRCLKLLGEAGSAARDGDRSAYNDAIEAAEPVCKEADRYL